LLWFCFSSFERTLTSEFCWYVYALIRDYKSPIVAFLSWFVVNRYFYASLFIGTPARTFAVIVDTGSTITYVPCANCGSACGPHHKGVAFDPRSSASATPINCGAEKCICGRPACGCSPQQECTYTRTYGEAVTALEGIRLLSRKHSSVTKIGYLILEERLSSSLCSSLGVFARFYFSHI
jgi:Xylanase inhibitor N-terminal